MTYRRARRWAGTAVTVAALAIPLSGCSLGNDVSAGTKNPCSLLTAADVQAATSQGTTDGTRTNNVCVWSTDGGGKFTVGVFGGGNDLFESATRAGEKVQVTGVGDKAAFEGNTQFSFIQVLKGSTNLRLDYSGPTAPDQTKMTDLARKATEKL